MFVVSVFLAAPGLFLALALPTWLPLAAWLSKARNNHNNANLTINSQYNDKGRLKLYSIRFY